MTLSFGSTTSTRSKKNASCANKISSLNVVTHVNEISKVSEKTIYMPIEPRFLIMNLYPNLTLRDIGTKIRRN
jgi:hypothetical protein